MAARNGLTIFIVGDRQVGKTSVILRLFENQDLMTVSSAAGATEYHVVVQQRELPVKILEIRNVDFFEENVFEFDIKRDVVFYCYAIDDPESFQNVAELWIPLFNEHISERMPGLLIGKKRDLRDIAEELYELADQDLPFVSTNQGRDLCANNPTIVYFNEWSMDDFEPLDQLSLICNLILQDLN